MRISDWSSDVCSSDLMAALATGFAFGLRAAGLQWLADGQWQPLAGGMIVYAVLAFHNQAYNPHCLMHMTQSCRSATMAFAGTLLLLDRKSTRLNSSH